MVVDYATDENLMAPDELSNLRTQVREGDMTVILKPYEQTLKNPLRNALSGDLIRLVLIQVHKSKVDLEIAMQALDKLLKSNELNFAFLAVIPTVIVVGAVGRWVMNGWSDRRSLSAHATHKQLRMSIR